jgi:hypothetical protein
VPTSPAIAAAERVWSARAPEVGRGTAKTRFTLDIHSPKAGLFARNFHDNWLFDIHHCDKYRSDTHKSRTIPNVRYFKALKHLYQKFIPLSL